MRSVCAAGGVALMLAGALGVIVLASALKPKPLVGCIRPTGFPPTWFGECTPRPPHSHTREG